MAKPLIPSKENISEGSGIQEGRVRIVDARSKINKPKKDDAATEEPKRHIDIELDLVLINDNGEAISDAETKRYPFSWEYEGVLSLVPCDKDGDALGDDPDTVGVGVVENPDNPRKGTRKAFQDDSDAIKLHHSLVECGIADGIGAIYTDLIGVEGVIHTVEGREYPHKKTGKMTKSRNQFFQKIDADSLKKGKGGKTAAKTDTKKGAATKKEETAAPEADNEEAVQTAAVEVIMGCLMGMKKAGTKSVSFASFKSKMTVKGMQIDEALQDGAKKIYNDKKQFAAIIKDIDGAKFDDDTVTYDPE